MGLAGYLADPWQHNLVARLFHRLILCCSRQSGKSRTLAFIAAIVALMRANDLVLIISGSKDQAKNTFIYIRQFLAALGVPLVEDTKMSCILANGSRIVILAPNAATVRSYAAPGMVIMDEGAWIEPEVYKAVEPMMATRPDCLYTIASTPNGKTGVFYETFFGITAEMVQMGTINVDWRGVKDEWHREMVTWEDCPRITPEYVQRQESRYGRRYVDQEYRCMFVEAEDSLFSVADVDAAFGHGVKPLFEDEEMPELVSSDVRPLV